MKFYPQYLSFEVTRRCNSHCEHCMRGDAQCLDLNLDYVDTILDDIKMVHYINFTGGEPSLNNACIKAIIDKIIERNIQVYGFDVVTNGVDTDKVLELIKILENFKSYCSDKQIGTSRLAISNDIYHKSVSLPDLSTNFEICYKKDLEGILNLGRARSLDIEKFDKDGHNFINYREMNPESIMLANSIVVSANGDVRLTVDYEYNSKEGVIGNVVTSSLSDIVMNEIHKEKEEERRRHFWAC